MPDAVVESQRPPRSIRSPMIRGLKIPALRDTASHKRATVIALSILLLTDFAVMAFIADGLSALRAYPFDTDEANHSLPALRMTQELSDGDWRGFISEVRCQNFYRLIQ